MVTLMGEAIHSGPETDAGEAPRIIVFLTCHPPGDEEYKRQEQLNPFTLASLARDAPGTVERSLEWLSPPGPYSAHPWWNTMGAEKGASAGEKGRAARVQAAVRRACEEPAWVEEGIKVVAAAFAEEEAAASG